jgi:hypothetical protein
MVNDHPETEQKTSAEILVIALLNEQFGQNRAIQKAADTRQELT